MGQRASLISLVQQGTEDAIENMLLNEKSGSFDYTTVDADGRNALHWAALTGRRRVLELLLDNYPFDINAVDTNGNTALHFASYRSHDSVVAVLLNKGADINAQDNNGMTPLHWAVRENNFECARYLIQNGAVIGMLNDKDKTVYDIAKNLRKKFREPMLQLLDSARKAVTPVEDVPAPTALSTVKVTDQHRLLASLCEVWGKVKFSHPFLAYRKDIDWDNQVVLTINKILEIGPNISSAKFFELLRKMLFQLKDPNTFVCDTLALPTPVSPIKAPPSSIEKRPQPYVKINRSTAVIVLNDYQQLNSLSKLDSFVNAFTSAVTTANTIVVDVRCLNPLCAMTENSVFSHNFIEAFRMFLKEPLEMPTTRQRFFHGLPEYKPGPTQLFYHAMITQDANYLLPSTTITGEHALKPMAFIVDKNTPLPIIRLTMALQNKKKGMIVYHADQEHVRNYTDGEQLLYEPGIVSSLLDLGVVKIAIRQAETVNPDGTTGFHPDAVVVREEGPVTNLNPDIDSDSVIGAARELLLSSDKPSPLSMPTTPNKSMPNSPAQIRASIPQTPPPSPASGVAPYHSVKATSMAIKMSLPSPTYRLLGLFSLWSAVNNFYVYKHLISPSVSLHEILLCSIPSFIGAMTDLEYALVVVDFLATLNDAHSYVNCESLISFVGTHVPPVKVRTVENQFVVTHVFQTADGSEASPDQLQVGDIILAIDEVTAAESRKKLQQVCFTSTPHGQNVRVDTLLLAGKQDSKAKLVVRRRKSAFEVPPPSPTSTTTTTTNGSVEEETRDLAVEVTRIVAPQNLRVVAEAPYSIIRGPEGNDIGYVDLRQLLPSDVPAVMSEVMSTKSLILDVRGPTKGSITRLAPYFTKTQRLVLKAILPILAAQSKGLSGLESSENMSRQFCHPHPAGHYYEGKLVALINEQTMSHGELACIYLKSCKPDTVFVGSQTNGAMANCTNLLLPGNVEVAFSCLGFSDAAGEVIQGVGLKPDILVRETIEDITEGRDTVLQTALHHLQ